MRQQAMLAETAGALVVLAGEHAARAHLDVLTEVTVPVGVGGGVCQRLRALIYTCDTVDKDPVTTLHIYMKLTCCG